MSIEKEVVSYLAKYGNTRECSIIDYGSRESKCSPQHMKKIIDRMAIKGKIHRIVHDKLEPPEVYVSLEESTLPEIGKERVLQMLAGEDTRRILEEAAAVAKQKIREMESERR